MGRERQLLLDAFDSNWLAPLGPQVDALEHEFAALCACPDAAALSSGTAALHLALRLLEIGPGQEVWTATLTFAATANAIRYVGAEPVFIDSEEQSWNIDPSLLADALADAAMQNRLPAAVIVVDLYGQCADYAAICEICDRFNVPIIEDAAEALGATYGNRPAGSFGTMACFSFNGNKIVTASGGGMLVAQDAQLCQAARWLASQARDDAPHYQHSTVGYNYRMSNLLAAVARGQLESLDRRVQRRRDNFHQYKMLLGDLPGLRWMPEPTLCHSTRWLTCVTIDPESFGATREDVRLHLNQHNIESRPVWKPMHLQPINANCRVIGGTVSEKLFERGLCLPSGSDLTDEQLQRIAERVRACCPAAENRKPEIHQTMR